MVPWRKGNPLHGEEKERKREGEREKHIGFMQEEHFFKNINEEVERNWLSEVFGSSRTQTPSVWKSTPIARVESARHGVAPGEEVGRDLGVDSMV